MKNKDPIRKLLHVTTAARHDMYKMYVQIWDWIESFES